MQQYNLIAGKYAQERMNSRIGLQELDELLEKLPKGSQILDFGAGTGKPLTERIAQHPHTFNVFAVDSSIEMVKIFQENLPTIPIQHASILNFDFFDTTFNAIVSWGVMFHLTENEQRLAIRSIASALSDGGYFLFTSGNKADTHVGTMFNNEFSYYSLDAEEYGRILAEQGMMLIGEYVGEGENYYYLAHKPHKM